MENFEPIFTNDGYRPNVGIIICNTAGQVLWARRVNRDGWQFPQGGVAKNESLLDALYRELEEETGLKKQHVRLLAHTKHWLHYKLPAKLLRNQNKKKQGRVPFKGQKQAWFLLELLSDDSNVRLQNDNHPAEFDHWEWVETEFALENIVDFKRDVYQQALSELAQYLPTHR